MRYAADSPRLFDSQVFRDLAGERRFTIIDGGAANALFDPFDVLDHHIQVYAFEPNAEARRYDAPVPVTFIDGALWRNQDALTLHVARVPTTSSVYPPNVELLKRFNSRIGEPARRTVRKAPITGLSIDHAVAQGLLPTPDFIKLDIHSSEYEALDGARKALARCSGVLVETWHSPVHKGQHLHAEVETVLNSFGFYLFHLKPICKWRHSIEGEGEPRSDSPRHIGSEGLFFRDDPVAGTELLAIALADLFRFSAFALDLTRRFGERMAPGAAARIESELRRIIRYRQSWRGKLDSWRDRRTRRK